MRIMPGMASAELLAINYEARSTPFNEGFEFEMIGLNSSDFGMLDDDVVNIAEVLLIACCGK